MKAVKGHFRGKKMTVVGLGRTGLAAANLLREQGAEVTASDMKNARELRSCLEELHPGVGLELGGHRRRSFLGAQVIVLSPGVPNDLPLLAEAEEKGVEIISEIEMAARLTEVPIIAVTGTNGKSTTTVLIGEILRAAGKRVSVGGNLGRPLAEMVAEKEPEYLVVEVSSYQLERTVHFRPRIALMLNISPDHLERHRDMKGYLEAKKLIYRNMGPGDCLIVNGDQEALAHFGAGCGAERMLFSSRGRVEQGAFRAEGRLVFRRGGSEREIISEQEIGLEGAHNLENVLASVAAASLCGAEPAAVRKALRGFKGLEHRLEPVGTLEGVLYVNDSKGTNVGAALKSLESFKAPIILIAGGRDKGGDYAPLSEAAQGKVKKAILLGEAGGKIAAAMNGSVETAEAADMEEAVDMARREAAPGDVVLLSPACSSFDMFRNFEERGKAFKKAVERLQEQNR